MEPLSPPPCPLQGIKDRDRARLRDNSGLPHRIPSQVGTDGPGSFPSYESPLQVGESLSREGLTASGHQAPLPGSLRSYPTLVSARLFYLNPGRFWLCPCARMFFFGQLHGGFPTPFRDLFPYRPLGCPPCLPL